MIIMIKYINSHFPHLKMIHYNFVRCRVRIDTVQIDP